MDSPIFRDEPIDYAKVRAAEQRVLEREERKMEEWIEKIDKDGRSWQAKLEMKEEGGEGEVQEDVKEKVEDLAWPFALKSADLSHLDFDAPDNCPEAPARKKLRRLRPLVCRHCGASSVPLLQGPRLQKTCRVCSTWH